MKKDIIILAAGIGSRLRPLTDEVPKCMVKVNGISIIERVLKQINSVASIDKKIYVVTGYKADVLKSFVDTLDIPNVQYIDNLDYNSTNNMYSLGLALQKTDSNSGLIVINADCCYDSKVVETMLGLSGNYIAIDKSLVNEESMKIQLNETQNVVRMSKALVEDNQTTFVSMDIYSFDSEFKKALKDKVHEIVSGGNLNSWTEVAIDLLSREYGKLFSYDFSGIGWMEIDNMADLEKAEQIFANQSV